MTKKYGWSKDVLINHIEDKSYEKYLINQTNFDETLPEKYVNQAKLAVKDEYIFDIMELSEQHSERELERALVDNIKDFLFIDFLLKLFSHLIPKLYHLHQNSTTSVGGLILKFFILNKFSFS